MQNDKAYNFYVVHFCQIQTLVYTKSLKNCAVPKSKQGFGSFKWLGEVGAMGPEVGVMNMILSMPFSKNNKIVYIAFAIYLILRQKQNKGKQARFS